MSQIEAIISDFGGVLTSPMQDGFQAVQDTSGISMTAIGKAMTAISDRRGSNPVFDLETGDLSEAAFLGALADELAAQLHRDVRLDDFGERYFDGLRPNEPMIGYMRRLRHRGYKLAICTNNVREWERLFRAKVPVDELFDVVVNSAFVGTRKPARRIYELTLERLDVPASAAIIIDDVELNCTAARELGMHAVRFRSTGQAIEEIEAALAVA